MAAARERALAARTQELEDSRRALAESESLKAAIQERADELRLLTQHLVCPRRRGCTLATPISPTLRGRRERYGIVH